jgi:hypothetical protein
MYLKTFIDFESNLFNSFLKNKNNFHFKQKKKKLNFFVYLNSYIKFLKKYACFLKYINSIFVKTKNKLICVNQPKIILLKRKHYTNTFIKKLKINKSLNLKIKYVCTFNNNIKYSSYIRIFNKNFILFKKHTKSGNNAVATTSAIENVVNTNVIVESVDSSVVNTENINNNAAVTTNVIDGGDAFIIKNNNYKVITKRLKTTNNFFNCMGLNNGSNNNKKNYYKYKTTKTTMRYFINNNLLIKKELKNLFNFYIDELFFKQYTKCFNLINEITIKFKLNIFFKKLFITKKYKNLRKIKINPLYIKKKFNLNSFIY